MKQLNRVAVNLLTSLLLGLGFFGSAIGASSLPQSPVSYTTSGDTLSIAMGAIERIINKRVVLDPKVDGFRVVTGRYTGATGELFLDHFAKVNHLVWDLQGNTVVFAPEGTVFTTPKSKGGAPSSFSKVLFDPKDPNKYGLMIFQVHNAQVEDRKAGGKDSIKVIPGVTTLFRQFIGVPAPVVKQTNTQNANNAPPPVTASGAAQQVSLTGLFVKGAGPVVTEETTSFIGDTNGRGVYSDVRLNAVLVRDKVSHFESYKQIIALLDRPADMVQLEAFIVDVQKDHVRELGINLGLAPGSVATNLVLNPFRARSLISLLSAMETEGTAESLSVPSVVSLNNEQALFSSRQNFFISVAGAYNATVNQVTAETQLLVTPQIANESADVPFDERRVKLLINVQDATADATNSTNETNLLISKSSTSTLPSTTENQINTQAVVRSGDSLVIGGQVVRKKLTKREGLPTGGILSGIFAKNTDEFHDYVRVYIVRPKILGEDSASAVAAYGDNSVTRLAKKSLEY